MSHCPELVEKPAGRRLERAELHLAGFRRLARRIRPSVSSPFRADDVDTEGLGEPEPFFQDDLERAAAEDALEAGCSPPPEPPRPEGPSESGSASDPHTPAAPAGG